MFNNSRGHGAAPQQQPATQPAPAPAPLIAAAPSSSNPSSAAGPSAVFSGPLNAWRATPDWALWDSSAAASSSKQQLQPATAFAAAPLSATSAPQTHSRAATADKYWFFDIDAAIPTPMDERADPAIGSAPPEQRHRGQAHAADAVSDDGSHGTRDSESYFPALNLSPMGLPPVTSFPSSASSSSSVPIFAVSLQNGAVSASPVSITSTTNTPSMQQFITPSMPFANNTDNVTVNGLDQMAKVQRDLLLRAQQSLALSQMSLATPNTQSSLFWLPNNKPASVGSMSGFATYPGGGVKPAVQPETTVQPSAVNPPMPTYAAEALLRSMLTNGTVNGSNNPNKDKASFVHARRTMSSGAISELQQNKQKQQPTMQQQQTTLFNFAVPTSVALPKVENRTGSGSFVGAANTSIPAAVANKAPTPVPTPTTGQQQPLLAAGRQSSNSFVTAAPPPRSGSLSGSSGSASTWIAPTEHPAVRRSSSSFQETFVSEFDDHDNDRNSDLHMSQSEDEDLSAEEEDEYRPRGTARRPSLKRSSSDSHIKKPTTKSTKPKKGSKSGPIPPSTTHNQSQSTQPQTSADIVPSLLNKTAQHLFGCPSSELTAAQLRKCTNHIMAKRTRNTEAARRSRGKRKEHLKVLEDRVEELEEENARMKGEIERLEALVNGRMDY